jgi:hypothetical protein
MASEETLEPATQEPEGEPETPEQQESEQDEPEAEDIEQVRAERDAYKRDYAALKKDYDEKAHDAKKPKKVAAQSAAASEDDTLWVVENAADLKMAGAEYKAYRAKGYDREDALYLARRDKGLIKSKSKEAERQADTSQPVQGELRNAPKGSKIPANIKKLRPDMTEEQYAQYKAEIDARRKR